MRIAHQDPEQTPSGPVKQNLLVRISVIDEEFFTNITDDQVKELVNASELPLTFHQRQRLVTINFSAQVLATNFLVPGTEVVDETAVEERALETLRQAMDHARRV